MISSPNISNKNWVYGQYDHEVGIRTVIKPGQDASVLRLDNGKFLAAKIDGNPKQCYIDPRQGVIGCFEEACRNVVCCGATPIGMVDHLQFGSPEDPEIFWTFLESLKGITDFAKSFQIPCVGGKVSFYNETQNGPIKPTPLIGVLGIINNSPLRPIPITHDDVLLIVGKTKNELGGSEYFEYIHDFIGGKCPEVDFKTSKKNMDAILTVIRKNLAKCIHDCSKGGLAIAISELCMINNIGCKISLEKIPSENLQIDRLLFSESHSRYLIVIKKNNLEKIKNILSQKNVEYDVIGNFGGSEIIFEKKSKKIVNLSVDKTRLKWMNSLEELVLHG
jgi:phosphoribosylformylglycinamidine synthase